MNAYVCPHPPIIVPSIGGTEIENVTSTVQAMRRVGASVAADKPEIVILMSPHSPAAQDAFVIKTVQRLQGGLGRFGAPDIDFDLENDVALAEAVYEQGLKANVGVFKLDEEAAGSFSIPAELDHGSIVPLYYAFSSYECPIVSLSISGLSYLDHYRFGMAIREAVERTGRKAAFLASGDMSHRLTPDAPAGYSEHGAAFDAQVKKNIASSELTRLFDIDQNLIDEAGECGLRSLFTMAGFFDIQDVTAEVLSYEGPFGVGYLVATIAGQASAPSRFDMLVSRENEKREQRISEECEPVSLAREAVETYVRTGKIIPVPAGLPALFSSKAGVFVSLKMGGRLRGCIGTTEGMRRNIAEEIIMNGIAAATEDPRFAPVTPDELDGIRYSVDVLNEPEPVEDESCLDPSCYGVIVSSGPRRGLLLPDIEGVGTVEEQLSIAKQKAGLPADATCRLHRFTVTRYR